MHPFLIVGNWKSNKNVEDTRIWITKFSEEINRASIPRETEIVICAPYTDITTLKQEILRRDIAVGLGAQDVSPFPNGAYTGEVSAPMLKELAEYVIIGHSERRKYFEERDEELVFEVEEAKKAGLTVIFCVSAPDMMVPMGVDIVAYEPLGAIGSGKNMDADSAGIILHTLKKRTGVGKALYGGSVTPENIASYAQHPDIDGVLVGGASLDPTTFFQLIVSSSR